MAGYPHIRYISSGLDGTSFRGPFRGNFEVCNRIKLDNVSKCVMREYGEGVW